MSDYNLQKQAYDLRKQSVIRIAAERGILDEKARVALVIDMSGSMNTVYQNGTVQRVIDRLLPIAVKFDDNAELDIWGFGVKSCRMQNATEANYSNFVRTEIVRHFTTVDSRGTNYAPVLKDIYKRYVVEEVIDYSSYVIFITDGENGDRSATTAIINELSKHAIFFQFVGIGGQKFEYLDKLDTMEGRFIDNANFFALDDLDAISDDDLYNRLLQEYPDWLELARSKGILAPKKDTQNPPKDGFWSKLLNF